MQTAPRTYQAHIGSLSVTNYLMATAGLTGNFFTEAVRSGLTKSQAVQYQCDAARLYLRSLESVRPSLTYFSAFLPQDEVFSLYKALIAVYKSNHPVANLVTKTHKIHTIPNPNIDRVAVVFDKEATWFTALQNGNVTVNYAGLNSILQRYNLVISKYFFHDEQCDGFTLFAQKPMNMVAIALELKQLPGVVSVEIETDLFSESDIRAVRTETGSWLLEYCLHKEDTPVAWLFEVNNLGDVFCKDGSYVPHAQTAKGYCFGQARQTNR